MQTHVLYLLSQSTYLFKEFKAGEISQIPIVLDLDKEIQMSTPINEDEYEDYVTG